jgi:hypothetical protein
MKRYALIFFLSLSTLSHLHAAPMAACGSHAAETKHPGLNWSRLTKIELTSFAGNVLMNICIGVDPSSLKIKRLVMRDSTGSINVQESLSSLAQFKELINQRQLPSAAQIMTRAGALMTMRVVAQGAMYVADIRLHRKLGRLSGTDIRHITVNTRVNASGDAEASFDGSFFDSLVVKIQTVPSLLLREFIIGDSSRRSTKEFATKTLPTATSLGL